MELCGQILRSYVTRRQVIHATCILGVSREIHLNAEHLDASQRTFDLLSPPAACIRLTTNSFISLAHRQYCNTMLVAFCKWQHKERHVLQYNCISSGSALNVSRCVYPSGTLLPCMPIPLALVYSNFKSIYKAKIKVVFMYLCVVFRALPYCLGIKVFSKEAKLSFPIHAGQTSRVYDNNLVVSLRHLALDCDGVWCLTHICLYSALRASHNMMITSKLYSSIWSGRTLISPTVQNMLSNPHKLQMQAGV